MILHKNAATTFYNRKIIFNFAVSFDSLTLYGVSMKSEEVLIDTYNFPMKSYVERYECFSFLQKREREEGNKEKNQVKEEKVPDNGNTEEKETG